MTKRGEESFVTLDTDYRLSNRPALDQNICAHLHGRQLPFYTGRCPALERWQGWTDWD